MPEHDPQVGQAERSTSVSPASSTCGDADAEIAVMRSVGACATPSDDDRLAGLHRAAGDEDRRDVEPHGGVEHARGDLVAVGDAHQRVGRVAVDHVLDGVRDHLAGGQRVEHPAVAHRDAVVHGDRVELPRHPARLADRAGDEVAQVLEVHVTGHELGVGVRDRDDRACRSRRRPCRWRARGRGLRRRCGRGWSRGNEGPARRSPAGSGSRPRPVRGCGRREPGGPASRYALPRDVTGRATHEEFA